ncbi:Zinc finger PHD-finger [Penicillium argentinense]|uniref:Chromatin modification-related protein n=1 Tax=Penicillium argentinense TaxID=1131581 RepID=A0A9W9EX26_9EURO|nr:Zinc finger PHD-finger [Penicillium argentinense]KAJ5089435.1 Zinc finger PHD-finger [Penicillium argentinense]
MSAVPSSTLNSQGSGVRQSARQTRTNPSRTSKTAGRSSFGFGRGSVAESPVTPPVPHGFYPALTHFTDAITALPHEFRRHNSLLKEVDAKAWALEENLLQLLKDASESQPVPHPPVPTPIVGGVAREEFLPKDLSQPPETPESLNRRILFDRVRQNLSDLMMTADEKNHVISNANEELDRQISRLDTVFPYIAGEISEEARLGSLTHWAYSNKNTAKAATNERPRREAVSQRQDLAYALHEAEAASRSEARREAVQARKQQRRAAVDADYEEARGARKTNTGKSRGDNATADQANKRRRVERPTAVDMGAPMERSASGTGSQRVSSKDGAEKKRSRAPNANAAVARKKPNAASNAGSPVLAPSPLIGTFNAPRGAASPGPNTSRPQSSRAQQNAGQTSNARQRPTSSASNRLGQPNSCMSSRATYSVTRILLNTSHSSAKPADPRSTPRDGSIKNETGNGDNHRDYDGDTIGRAGAAGAKRDDVDGRTVDSVEAEPAKGRNSKTSTPVLSTFSETTQSRSRPTRSTDPAPKRGGKKTSAPAPVIPSDDESLHEGDDEDEEGEPRYCYCNEISFGEMVACDNDACPREWFHLACVGLHKPPGKNVKWYCTECKENMRRGRNGR